MTQLAIRPELLGSLPETTQRQLRTYRDLLFRWNQRFNLTAIREPDEIDSRLIADALRLLPAIDEELGARNGRARLIDLGTGAGLPGLVIKIARPDIEMVLMDATNKKIQFVQHAITELGLLSASTVHSRAEDIGHHVDYRGPFDLVTARGVAALPTLVELTVPLLVVGGAFLFPKGENIADERRAGDEAAKIVGGRIDSAELLPGDPSEPVTRLVRGSKIGTTPGRYPRRAGIPNKEPLGRDGQ
jgi:16S rRNA (guanine527-N7)-methyltransferase